MKVTLTEPEIAGEYIVEERGEDGTLVLVPDTSAETMMGEAGMRPLTDAEFDREFGDLPSDDEG